MDRGPRVPDNIKLQIAKTYQEMRKKNPKIKAPAVREAVQCRLKKVPYPGWPGLSVVQKVITDIHKKEADPLFSRQDEPWCLACQDEPLSPDALKAVCEVWETSLNNFIDVASKSDSEKSGAEFMNKQLVGHVATKLSIREAKWIARLYCIIKEDTEIKPFVNPTRLYSTALLYARAEQLHELIGITFNSTEMDHHLILGIPKLIKVNIFLLNFLSGWLMTVDEGRAGEWGMKHPAWLDVLTVYNKFPDWLIPLLPYRNTEEALEIMRQQNVKIPARIESTKKAGKK
jgi:hypothetical protein